MSKYVNLIKGMTSNVLQEEFKEDLKHVYWKSVFWAVGYFVTTVGEINDTLIRDYIEGQESREKDESNSDEVWGS